MGWLDLGKVPSPSITAFNTFSFMRILCTCLDPLFSYSSRHLTALGAESPLPVSFVNRALKQWSLIYIYIFETYSTHLKFELSSKFCCIFFWSCVQLEWLCNSARPLNLLIYQACVRKKVWIFPPCFLLYECSSSCFLLKQFSF